MAQKEHPSLARIKGWVREIDTLESSHMPVDCHRYAPGRCPTCLRIHLLEQDQIDREVTIIEEDVWYSLKNQPEALEEAMRLLAQADVSRCHNHGKWPRSIAEIEDVRLVAASLRRRLSDGFSIDEHDSDFYETLQRRDALIETQYVPAYQRFYREACLERWELSQFEHYAPTEHQAGRLSLDFIE